MSRYDVDNSPLVSIIVITYNSSKYIVETLESIKSQRYSNIELIISDDGSTDDTISICSAWLNDHRTQFANVVLSKVETNTGIPSNCNRGAKIASGTWIKFLGGDDILDINCIQSFVNFASRNRPSPLLCCNLVTFRDNIKNKKERKVTKVLSIKYNRQRIVYACKRPTIAPFVMMKKELYLELGGFDESFQLLEDLPFFNNALIKDKHFELVEQNLVYYRVLNNSVSNASVPNKLFKSELKRFVFCEIKPYLSEKGLFLNMLKIHIEHSKIVQYHLPKLLKILIVKLLKGITNFELKLYCLLFK